MTQRRFKRVNVEISNSCNLHCSFCPTVERAKQLMTPERFAAVVEQLAPLTEEVVLHLLGEPLSHPEFDKILDACAAAAVPVNIVTNGVLMTGSRPGQLLRPIVRQVSFSLHSFSDNFGDQDPAPYFRRLQGFIEQALVGRPDLYINLRLWDLTGPAAEDCPHNGAMRDLLAQAYGFDWADVKVDLRRRKNWRIKGRLYLHFDTRFDWPSLAAPFRSDKGFCHGLTGHFGIHADGTVVPCCLDHRADIPLGNAFDTPVAEILAGPRAMAIRDGFARGELVEALCQRCNFITRFKQTPSVADTRF